MYCRGIYYNTSTTIPDECKGVGSKSINDCSKDTTPDQVMLKVKI